MSRQCYWLEVDGVSVHVTGATKPPSLRDLEAIRDMVRVLSKRATPDAPTETEPRTWPSG